MSLAKTAIHRPVTVLMCVVAVLLFGLVALDRLAVNLLPEISYPSLTVLTTFEDAAPEEVESLITRPVEEAVGVVPGLRRLVSISRPGQSEVVLEFAWDSNMDLSSMDVREKLDLIELPRDAEKPVILRFDPAYDPIMRIQLHGELSLSRLRYLAERELKKGLESTEGVGAVKVSGGREEQIHIEIDEKRLSELNIPITEVTRVIEQSNLNRASGSLYDLDASYLVRFLNEFRSVEEIGRIVIRNEGTRQIVLGDVARVWRGTKDRDIITRLNGAESVELAVYKEGDANAVTVSEAVRSRLTALTQNPTFPAGVKHKIVFDQAQFITESVDNVLSAAALGGLIATLILFLFLRDLRSTIIIALSIPISILATFFLMYQFGVTLNIMSLGGVALGVGMLVDNSIVVLEAVHRRKGTGTDPGESALQGTTEVGRAVTASTLTTVAVFLPLVFVEGIAGQLFRDQALTITYSLLSSLLIALTFVPMVLALRANRRPLEPGPESHPASVAETANPAAGRLRRMRAASSRVARAAGRFIFVEIIQVLLTDLRRLSRSLGKQILRLLSPILDAFEKGFDALYRNYPRLLTWSLDRSPLVLIVAVVSALLALLAYPFLGVELIPPLAQGEFYFEIKLPEGTPIERSDRMVRQIEERVKRLPGVETVFSSIGASSRNQFTRLALEENAGQLYVTMKERRDKAAEQVTIDRIRDELQQFPELAYTFGRPTLFSLKNPVEVEIYAFDIEEQRRAAETVAARLANIEGLSDIRTTTERGNPEIQVRLDRVRLARLGMDESRIADTLRNKIRGDVASRYRDDDRLIDILVRARQADRRMIEDIRNLVINISSAEGQAFRESNGPAADDRQPGAGLDDQAATGARSEERAPTTRETATEVREVIPIRLGAVADVKIARGPSEIRRIGSQRAAVVSANLSGRDLSSVSEEIRAALQELREQIPANASVALAGQNEELERSYDSLFFSLALAVFLVYLVMASQFESLIHPFVILFTVPLGLIGVILSLFLTGTTVSVVVLLGVIILAGIVVNNAIVLVDYTNQLRQEGLSTREALVQAGRVRLRPILMTTLTTVLGLFPMALGWGEGAEVRAPMAVTVMGGLVFSTLLTLVLIPVVYEWVDRKIHGGAEQPAKTVNFSGHLPPAQVSEEV